jgi:ribose transport system permease protein
MTSSETQLAPPAEPTPPTTPGAPVEGARTRIVSPYLWVWAGVLLIYVLMLIITPNAASMNGLSQATPFIGFLIFAAIGQTFVIMQRGIDFSVVSIVILVGMVLGKLSTSGIGIGPAIVIALLVGALLGLVNGTLVVYLRLTPLVATLAANLLYLGLAILISFGAPVPVASELEDFIDGKWFGVSPVLVFAVVFAAILVVLLNRTVLGRRFVASGSNPLTARAAGIGVNRYVLTGYVLAGFCYGITGILLASYVGDSRLTSGTEYLMASIAAVVIGGTPLTGGRGSIIATVGGAIFMALLAQFVLAAGWSTALQTMVEAIVFIAAVTLPRAFAGVRAWRAHSRPIAA